MLDLSTRKKPSLEKSVSRERNRHEEAKIQGNILKRRNRKVIYREWRRESQQIYGGKMPDRGSVI